MVERATTQSRRPIAFGIRKCSEEPTMRGAVMSLFRCIGPASLCPLALAACDSPSQPLPKTPPPVLQAPPLPKLTSLLVIPHSEAMARPTRDVPSPEVAHL